MSRRVIVHDEAASLAEAVAHRFLVKVEELLRGQETVHVCLTGGSSGINVLRVAADLPRLAEIDWSRVHFWWGDDRYVPADHPDRNDLQARQALLGGLVSFQGLREENIHPLPPLGALPSIESAVEAAAAELAAFGTTAPDGTAQPFPRFDICFLGVGPDGHVASLFPGRANVRVTEHTVVAELDSPKPPRARISLTMPVLNASERVWFVLAGSDKSSALGLSLAGASPMEVPAAGVEGQRTTIFFVDRSAAADVPHALIAPEEEWTGSWPLR